MVFSANKIPGSADVTDGYLERWVVIPFPNRFVSNPDPNLSTRLTTATELAGIACKGVAALRRLMERGVFLPPPSVAEMKEEFARKVDQVRSWVDEVCEQDPQHWTDRTHLYQSYRLWVRR